MIDKFIMTTHTNDIISEIILDPSIIDRDNISMGIFCGYDLCCILKAHPYLIHKLEKYIKVMDGSCISELLQAHPKMLTLISKTTGEFILTTQLLGTMDGWDISSLLMVRPNLLELLPNIQHMSGSDLCRLIVNVPGIIDRLPSLEPMDGYCISIIIKEYSYMISNKRIMLSKLSGKDVGNILSHKPFLIKDLSEYLSRMSVETMYFLLMCQRHYKNNYQIYQELMIIIEERRRVQVIFDFKYDDFKLNDYHPWPTIKAPIAV